MKRIYPNGKIVSLPQFDHFVRFMNKHGMKKILQTSNENLSNDILGSLHGYIEAIFELTREYIYDVDGSVIPDDKIYTSLDLCQFYKLLDNVGTSFSEPVMRELVAVTKMFVTYIMVFLNNNDLISLLEDDLVIHEVNNTNIIIEVDQMSYGFQ